MPVIERDDIPYLDLALKLFDTAGNQKLIPFLGAGVSARPAAPAQKAAVRFPDEREVEAILNRLQLSGGAGMFLRWAIAMAYVIASKSDEAIPNKDQVLAALINKGYPPSVSELTRAFATLAQYTSIVEAAQQLKEQWPPEWTEVQRKELVATLQELVQVAGLSGALESLSGISGYYETRSGREALWETLHRIFQKKEQPTATHSLLSEVAEQYLRSPDTVSDYLVVTANYDCLMEKALEARNVNFAAVTMRKSDGRIYVRFSDALRALADRNPPAYANHFTLQRRNPLVLIYKIHGCLYEGYKGAEDSVIISDNDYVDYLSRMADGNGVIPAAVKNLMKGKPFLFLGYSLNDWNVRSIFQKMVDTRGDDLRKVQDYSVTVRLSRFEEAYCERRDVNVLKTDLDSFAQNILASRALV